MKENKSNYGIKINNKVPKLDNQLNKYYKKIKICFEGKVFILNDGQEKQKELKNGEIIKDNGEYKLKFINTKNEIYFIKIKIRKLNILFFLLPLILMISTSLCFFNISFNIDKQMLFDFINYEYQFEGNRYIFDFNCGDEDYKNVQLYDKTNNTSKICPGSSGHFYIKINTLGGNKDFEYKMQVKQEINKPQNLKFRVNGKIYNSIKEVADDINGSIVKNSNKFIKIEWFWEYDAEDDYIDTNDGENLSEYKVLMRMIGNEKI